ncbi:FKBP-type peptidyl-prolyl cis-trans isomerase FklB [Parapedobacter composti]|uniref:Peptidyl-prolyl cis-trans isomerase n=1 Tax=Parapedobacter composti TaxID=623281 RepID=A0A1I1HEN5_9SPHI|nr:FKBP-type peptidyl-prolyl cis-trans isomerase [Parapedobacter composti]SFC22467.1 FKBP-type peptidyl-prolyl cis-trans isomerase FklB [Parapedobacter composti]
MKLSTIIAVSSVLMAATNAHAQLKNQADSVAYAFGASIARDLKQAGLETINAAVLAQAVADVFSGNDRLFDEGLERELIMGAITAAREKMDAKLRNEADEFMAGNQTRQGVNTTASGLQYEVIRAGEGEKPTVADTVTVHYKGQLRNGQVFDSSYDRGEPATFPLERVIQGWIEGLQLMPAGSHYRLYVPYALGYGERGAGPDIPPYSPLIFDVELISVKKGGEVTPVADSPAHGTK